MSPTELVVVKNKMNPVRNIMMRKICVFVLICIIMGCDQKDTLSPESQKSEKEIKASYAVLKAALRNGNGSKAVLHVTPNTVAAYERCRKLAIDSSTIDLEAISQIDVLMILCGLAIF